MTKVSPVELIVEMKASHARERALIDGLTDKQARAASTLPGWSRAHVLACRLAFVRAVNRQLDYALTDRLIEFVDGGVTGRDAYIEANACRPAAELVEELTGELTALDARWTALKPQDWTREAVYRGPSTLADILLACWRESEIHLVDLDLGVRPSTWSRLFCLLLFDFLEPRVPEDVQLNLTTPEEETWTLGSGEPIQLRGALTDLAAWLSGREPVGTLESSAGSLPELGRLRDARAR
jgi:maleylpyruvate isomerase